jgi:hypothetical protein
MLRMSPRTHSIMPRGFARLRQTALHYAQLLAILRAEAPQFFDLAEVVGR